MFYVFYFFFYNIYLFSFLSFYFFLFAYSKSFFFIRSSSTFIKSFFQNVHLYRMLHDVSILFKNFTYTSSTFERWTEEYVHDEADGIPPFYENIKKILRDLPTSMPSLRHAWVPLPPAHFDETLPRTKVPFRDFLHGASFHGLLRI